MIFDWEATTKVFIFFLKLFSRTKQEFEFQNLQINWKYILHKTKILVFIKKKKEKKKKGGLKGSPNILISFSNCLFQKIIFILILLYAKKKVILIGVTHFFVQMHAYTYMQAIIMHSINPHFVKLFLKTLAWTEGHTIFINTQHDAFALRVKVCGGDLCVGTVGQ